VFFVQAVCPKTLFTTNFNSCRKQKNGKKRFFTEGGILSKKGLILRLKYRKNEFKTAHWDSRL
jgi:hypothetical protein